MSSTVARPLLHMALSALAGVTASAQADIMDEVDTGHVDNEGVSIHYATMGEGPLLIMIHGFPDFWYSWRHQMEGLSDRFRVVAIDQRGYNRSDQPDEESAYAMRELTSDVAAVIRHFDSENAIIAGHDWGGSVAWQFAFRYPQMVSRLIVLNLPHPAGMMRELAINPAQREGSEYARRFREGSADEPDIFFGGPMTAQTLSAWVSDPEARQHYEDAFRRSDFDAMLAYYKQNYPELPPAAESAPPPPPGIPELQVPVLLFHGLEDTALHSDGLNNTWDWINADTTLVTIPDAGHFVQQDAADMVTDTMRWWLLARQ